MSANLVPLHIDKNSGKIVAKHAFTAAYAIGFFMEFATATDTWIIVHGQNTKRLLYQLFDENYQQLIPDSATIVDNNTIEIKWTTPQRGFVHIAFFES